MTAQPDLKNMAALISAFEVLDNARADMSDFVEADERYLKTPIERPVRAGRTNLRSGVTKSDKTHKNRLRAKAARKARKKNRN